MLHNCITMRGAKNMRKSNNTLARAIVWKSLLQRTEWSTAIKQLTSPVLWTFNNPHGLGCVCITLGNTVIMHK